MFVESALEKKTEKEIIIKSESAGQPQNIFYSHSRVNVSVHVMYIKTKELSRKHFKLKT